MTIRTVKIAGCAVAAALFAASAGVAQTPPGYDPRTHAGRASVYQSLDDNSLERVETPDHIAAVAQGNVAPTEIWTTLEHGEKVECLSCIPQVAKLLFDSNAKTREISAWWLRRRIFGVFGPGEVYSTVIDTLKNDPSETRRAYAADALGEFLLGDGIPLVASALVSDGSPLVRKSAAHALERLNDQGPSGELATAMADSSPDVRLAALRASARINVFSHVDAIAGRLSDDVPEVRRSAAEVLGEMRAQDSVVGLIALTAPEQEPDPRVRSAAIGALGKIGDPSAHDAVDAALSDPDPLVASVARIALRRL
jgi:HEAT repeat protein